MMTIVRVLLIATIESLGHIGEVVEVADGHARNYLFPRGLATRADTAQHRQLWKAEGSSRNTASRTGEKSTPPT
ncbi:hypothetical protein KAX17_03445 [Candidatus Bipolaricaulota bacterium]|nr:hypothetical protein [Candidatus Bipolaricaulota bacterium]